MLNGHALKYTMAKDLQTLLTQQLKLHELRGAALTKRTDKAIAAVQEICPHTDVEKTSTYHSGGYDYCAETRYKVTCKVCDKVVKAWTQDHPGVYG